MTRVYLIWICLFFPFSVFAQKDDLFSLISKRVHQHQQEQVTDVRILDEKVNSYLEQLDISSGKWIDVDYYDHKRINPSWLSILERMRSMTVAYTHAGSKFYADPILWQSINKSLWYFSTHKPLPYCDNWYQQGISRPQNLALSLINMQHGKKQLDEEVIMKTIAAACKDTSVNSAGRNNPMHVWNSGANKSEIAVGWVYLSALLKDENMLRVAIREAFSPLSLTTGEGIQYDLSYDFHHGYLYNGTYGLTFVRSVLEVADFVKGTSYGLQGDKLDVLRLYFQEGVLGIQRGKWLDWNVVGRGISRLHGVENDLTHDLERMIEIDTKYADFYQSTLVGLVRFDTTNTDIQVSNRYFWHTDFAVHRRPEYYFSIHGVSDRNHAQEIGNKENLKGYWGAQGTMNLMVRGDEYQNIFPVWDWTKLPGTTLPDSLIIPKDKAPGSGDRMGTSNFVGGVTDSIHGIKVYTVHNDLQTSYKKAWFMLEDEIVCLGAGISSSLEEKQVFTSLNQVISKDKQVFYQNGKQRHISVLGTQKNSLVVDQVFHDGVGYVFEHSQAVDLRLEERLATWSEITGSGSGKFQNSEVRKPVFYLGINHGVKPKDAGYAYRIFPTANNTKNLKILRDKSAKIIQNTADIQAIYHKQTDSHYVVLYKANTVYKYKDIEISSNIPCVFILKMSKKGGGSLRVADPTQKNKIVNFKVKIGKREYQPQINLPKNVYAGNAVYCVF